MTKGTEGKQEEALISKKELLSLTHISYGQLYRWKRMNIIPEDWFIKKSSITGQETYFKRDKILERIEMILSMKDTVSLDEIAAIFNRKEEEKTLDLSYIKEKKAVSDAAIKVYESLYGNSKPLGKREIIILAIIEKYLLKSEITAEEIKLLMEMMEKAIDVLYNQEGRIALYRKIGVPFVVGYKNNETVVIDTQAVKIIEVDLVQEFTQMNKRILT